MDQPSSDLGVLDQTAVNTRRKRMIFGVLAAAVLLVTVFWVVSDRATARKESQRAAAEAARVQAQELWALSGLDLTKLPPAEYSEAKLAEPDPERLRTLLLHLADGRAQYWADRLRGERVRETRSDAEEQFLAWQRNIYHLRNWRPGLAPVDLGELKRKALEFALDQEHLHLQAEIERLKAAKGTTAK